MFPQMSSEPFANVNNLPQRSQVEHGGVSTQIRSSCYTSKWSPNDSESVDAIPQVKIIVLSDSFFFVTLKAIEKSCLKFHWG